MSVVFETKSVISNEDNDNEFASTSNDLHNEEDSGYDPNVDAEQEKAVYDEDQVLDVINDEELENDIQEIKNAKKEDESPLIDVNSEDEDKLINSEYFESELLSAFKCVEKKAKFDGEQILSVIREQYMDDTGMEAPDEMIKDALKIFTHNTASTESTEETDDDDIDVVDDEQDIDDDGDIDDIGDDIDDAQNDHNESDDDGDDVDGDIDGDIDDEQDVNNVDPELFAKEMDDALDTVRKLGAFHQKQLVNTICGTYTEVNGTEPTTEQIKAIYIGIKERLSNEARDDFVEVNDKEDDEDDSDYDYHQDAMQQIEIWEDKEQETNEELERMSDIIEKMKFQSKTFLQRVDPILSKSKQLNLRGVGDDNKMDEDYIPVKDTFDYSRDIDDDIKSEQSVDENVDTSIMVNI